MSSGRRWAALGAAVLAVGVVVITVSIAHEPSLGASGSEELRTDVEAAVTADDADALQLLLAPDTAGGSYGVALLERLPQPVAGLRVELGRSGDDEVVRLRGDDERVRLCWLVVEQDGRSFLDGVPPAVPCG